MIDITKYTPVYTKDWYVKWVSSVFLIIAQALTSVGGLEPFNLMFFWAGLVGWLLVGYWWHDRALIFINAVGLFINTSGIMKWYWGA